jgi:nucleoid-associated protein YgaU
VAAGDSFWTIAVGVATTRLGRSPTNAEVAPLWQALIHANTQLLVHLGDTNLIYPGQVFKVPPP